LREAGIGEKLAQTILDALRSDSAQLTPDGLLDTEGQPDGSEREHEPNNSAD